MPASTVRGFGLAPVAARLAQPGRLALAAVLTRQRLAERGVGGRDLTLALVPLPRSRTGRTPPGLLGCGLLLPPHQVLRLDGSPRTQPLFEDLAALAVTQAGQLPVRLRRDPRPPGILQRALLGQVHTLSVRLRALTDDPANSVHQLITGSRRALAELTALRTRWQRARMPGSTFHTSHPTDTSRHPGRPSSPHHQTTSRRPRIAIDTMSRSGWPGAGFEAPCPTTPPTLRATSTGSPSTHPPPSPRSMGPGLPTSRVRTHAGLRIAGGAMQGGPYSPKRVERLTRCAGGLQDALIGFDRTRREN